MRLIDKEQAYQTLSEYYHHAGTLQHMALREALDRVPVVDAVPVRHGKWIHEVRYTIDSLHSYQQNRCSECGMTYITNTKYCPNCGARMEEE